MTDASVIINLNATERANVIIDAMPHPFLVIDNVLHELRGGESRGHRCGLRLEKLIARKLVELVELREVDEPVYRSLIEGGIKGTLGDGEAASIAYAVGIEGIALIDDRKARAIAATSFPDLAVASTTDLLLHPLVRERLGEIGQSDAIYLALRYARMHVPRHALHAVVQLIGEERAAECVSLPRAFRGSNRSSN